SQTPTGRPVDDLPPYLAAAGHVVGMRAGGSPFAPEHADVTDDRGRQAIALPGQTFSPQLAVRADLPAAGVPRPWAQLRDAPGSAFGPELDVHAEFPTAGVYRLWAQFRLADGSVITAPFTVEAT